MDIAGCIYDVTPHEEIHIIKDSLFNVLALADSDIPMPFLTFVDDEKYITSMGVNAALVLTTEALKDAFTNKDIGVVVSGHPRILYFKIHNHLSQKAGYRRDIFKTTIGDNCTISPLAVIADNNVRIGNNVQIEEFVVIRENTEIGNDSILRAGTIVGGVGFEFKRTDGAILPVAHCGGVHIGNHVEFQQGCCVDRAVYPWDNTVIGDFCKIDNLVHVGHAVKIGPRVLMAAGITLSGCTTFGPDIWIGPGGVISNSLSIGKDSRISLGAVVTQSVPENTTVSGNFAIEHAKLINHIKKIR